MQQRFAILLSAASLVVTAACSQSDTGITTAVKTKMAADDTVKASEINVDTHNRVVTLNGTVGSQAEKERAVTIARDTNGVASVVDDLTIGPVPAATGGGYTERAEDKASEAKEKTEDAAHDAKVKTENAAHDAKVKGEQAADKAGEVITDAAITSAVKTKFLAEPGVSGLNIDVDTSNGVVTLTGKVKTQAEANKAMSIARDSKGVTRVVNNLKVG
ncbi:MAG TPA: BON domain-containing protein [Vicinamibacterales bacterium]|jgi:hyperosmotically inducible protein|nr:BON domain-containing protein [Vicinamibacterales bacterium]